MTRRIRFSPLLTAGLFAAGALAASSRTALAREVPFSASLPISTSANVANAVAFADIDGDGDLDALSTSFVDNKVAWYENTGSAWVTHNITTVAGGAISVAASDVDGDGDSDVLSASSSDDKIAWYENTTGTGAAWSTHTISTAADGARGVSTADVDRDGDLDVVAVSRESDAVSWYENAAGNGSAWTARTISTEADGARGVHTADVDGDGDADVLSASPFDNTVAWYENVAGNGTAWTTHTVSTATNQAYSVATADVDRDGDVDVVSASANNDKIAWHENLGGAGGAWLLHTIATLVPGAVSVFAADVDGDGDVDVLSASLVDDKVAWHENLAGDGSTWLMRTVTTGADGADAVAAADLDGDGDLDLLAASGTDDTIAWFRNETIHRNACLRSPANVSTALDRPFALALADVDGDGATDVLSASTLQDTVGWLRNASLGTSWTAGTIATDSDYASAVATADVDGDGDLDAISTAEFDDRIAWHENVAGNGTAWATHTVTTSSSDAADAHAADLDGDGDADILVADTSGDRVAWHENTGQGAAWLSHFVSTSTTYVHSVVAADVDRDGDLDVISGSRGSASQVAWHENTAGNGSAWVDHTVTTGTLFVEDVAAADVDGDGDVDIAVGARHGVAVGWLENTGAGASWLVHTLRQGYAGTTSASLADLDADGDPDLLASFRDEGRFVWFENVPAAGAWAMHEILTGADSPKSVAAADVDGDGDLDAVTVSYGDDRIAWTRNDGGQVSLAATPLAPPAATAGQLLALTRLDVSHLGRAGDSDLALARLGLRFEETAGDPLTTAEANALVESLRLYRDANGNGVFDPVLDSLVTLVPTLVLSAGGEQAVVLADGDPGLQVGATATASFFIVAELTANAGSQSPNRFRVTHLAIGPSASSAEDRSRDLLLSTACAADVASAVTQIGPGAADVAATKTVTGQLREGGTVAYAIVLTNAGPGVQADNPGNELADVVPSSLTVIGADDGGDAGTVSVAGNAVAWNGALAPAGGVTITIQAQVNGGTAGTLITNQGTVAYDPAGSGSNTASRPTDDPGLPGPADPTSFTAGLPSSAELAHGASRVVDLAPLPGPFPDRDLFRLRQEPRASYEIVIDSSAGEVGAGSGPLLDRVAADGSTVLQSSVAIGAGPGRSLRFENAAQAAVTDQIVRVRSAGCGTDCSASDLYRVRAYETTMSGTRFNNSGTQVTILLLQNASTSPLAGHVWLWDAAGGLAGEQAFTIPARGAHVLNLAIVAPGAGGSVTVSHDGAYGTLVGKAVALEPSTGFTFDTPLTPRAR